ncbi:uncharacterized protein LOC135077930 [Ostrinia nubilalis]|uniref:uncharacterized protein LOC135077930 n=1 Tax=Ostrinia nubilalis TaxID=29057 RepID=UPI0030826152
MRVAAISIVLAACVWLTAGDVAHLKAAKAKLVGRLAGKHHKRGIFSAVPPFKLGHDIPHVTHSLVKPLVVTYPPTATVAAVKVPLSPPLGPRYPVSVGHKVPLSHSHFGHKFHHQTKTVLVPKPDHHFHHHHHHVEPKPVVPVLPAPPVVHATPIVPVAQPTGVHVAHPVPAPSPPVVVQSVPEPVVHAQPIPLAPPPLHFLRPQHVPLRPLVPIAPIQPANAITAPSFPLAHQFPYVLRPGNAVQTSYFATYPRHPLLNYQGPILPFSPATALSSVAPSYDQVFLNRPQVLLQQDGGHEGVFEHHHPSVVVEPTPTLLHPTQGALPQPAIHLQPAQPTVHLQPAQPTVHLQPAQPTVHLQPAQPTVHLQPAQPTIHLQPTQPAVTIDHNGWSPVPAQPHDLTPVQQPEGHFPLDTHHFTQEQGTQVYEHHTGNDQQFHDQQFHDQQFHDQQFHDQQLHDQQYHDYQHQLQHHIQQQIDQAQYEQHLNNQHQLNQEYGAPQQEYGQPNHDFSQQNQDFAQHAHEYAQHVQEHAQHAQDYAQTNEYNLQQQQPAQEYGAPQQLEGRSAEGEGEGEPQRFHNHIPLGLQPPIDRPLEHFR